MIQKITLLELNKSIQNTLNSSFSDSIWVVAEISELKVNRNGHCYIELIEKDIVTDNIIAKTRATIWAFTYRMLKPYFENTTGQALSTGIKILVQASIEFHEMYGLSLNITDIDPNYTLGDLARKKLEILKKLEDDGVIDMNKELDFPLVPQKIAIISSETAAGYQDFVEQLTNNNYGLKFYYKLFPSVMQGLNAEESIIASLEKIYENEELFDLVVIIRGGGSQADLSCFDNYLLATNIAQFPLPILTGIGHDKDESIADKVAHLMLKTPTAVAEFLIDKTYEYDNYLNLEKERLESLFDYHFENLKKDLSNKAKALEPAVNRNIVNSSFHLKLLSEKLKTKSIDNLKSKNLKINNYLDIALNKAQQNITSRQRNLLNIKASLRNLITLSILSEQNHLNTISSKIELLNPINILKRGYSLTIKNGKPITDINDVNKNDEIITKLFNGFICSTVNEKKIKN